MPRGGTWPMTMGWRLSLTSTRVLLAPPNQLLTPIDLCVTMLHQARACHACLHDGGRCNRLSWLVTVTWQSVIHYHGMHWICFYAGTAWPMSQRLFLTCTACVVMFPRLACEQSPDWVRGRSTFPRPEKKMGLAYRSGLPGRRSAGHMMVRSKA